MKKRVSISCESLRRESIDSSSSGTKPQTKFLTNSTQCTGAAQKKVMLNHKLPNQKSPQFKIEFKDQDLLEIYLKKLVQILLCG